MYIDRGFQFSIVASKLCFKQFLPIPSSLLQPFCLSWWVGYSFVVSFVLFSLRFLAATSLSICILQDLIYTNTSFFSEIFDTKYYFSPATSDLSELPWSCLLRMMFLCVFMQDISLSAWTKDIRAPTDMGLKALAQTLLRPGAYTVSDHRPSMVWLQVGKQ